MMDFKYKVSFILPTYNVSSYLEMCLESILAQSIDKEIIIVDDGSTDSSLTIALGYAARYSNIVVIHTTNRGVSAARNLGLRVAQGEFVMWIEPDDTLDSALNLESIYQLAKQCNVSVIKGQFDNYTQNSPHIHYKNKPTNQTVIDNTACLQTLLEFYKNALQSGWFIQIGCFLIKRAFLEKNNLHYEESLSVGEDGLFNIDLFSCDDQILEVPYLFLNYRVHGQSVTGVKMSSTRLNATVHSLALIQKRMDDTENPELKRLMKLTLAIYRYFLHRDVELADPELKEQFAHLITPELIEFYCSHGVQVNRKELS
ncbi:glycosyltransferase family 2 protein [Rodentibacter caecimuris]|uniref:glycosyltransferase family 2 protein n=1 Tax=Rodentibacter caecimuris TaxID=1796644 RepID=UPI0009861DC4|nr:hypothetical protein BKG97_00085 [Rodentibacter heylii]